MKATIFLTALIPIALSAQDINLTNRVATFTNLDGTAHQDVLLIKADSDGIIWRKEASGGRVCYTNLQPEFLIFLGLSTNRIEVARTRAGQKAVADARNYAASMAQAQAAYRARQAEWAHWTANQEARNRSAQQQADLAAINALADQIDAAKAQARREAALVHDYNMANMHNDYAPMLYQNQTALESITDAEGRLERMQIDYMKKYPLKTLVDTPK